MAAAAKPKKKSAKPKATKKKTRTKAAKKPAPKPHPTPAPKPKPMSCEAEPQAAPEPTPVKPSRNYKPVELRRKREYKRGESPFSTPSVGDVLLGNDGTYRAVTAYDAHSGAPIAYASLDPGDIFITPAGRPITRSAWAAWCSRSSATLIARNDAEFLCRLANARTGSQQQALAELTSAH